MVNVLDVDAQKFVEELTKELQKSEKLKPEEWSFLVKSGMHKENPPIQKDFWYRRAASMLRNIYIHGPKGVQKLKVKYGGKKKRGTRAEKRFNSGGKIIRTIFKQLEGEGLVSKVLKEGKKGRQLTPKAVKMMDNLAYRIHKGA
ncbi:30S ribosomal protein S19e [Candidatus Tiddalikarchaeum anstoanum]|nr:30S ribosomal protein S19e [Candidatus Tiddalikarchaeum anstoanum]